MEADQCVNPIATILRRRCSHVRFQLVLPQLLVDELQSEFLDLIGVARPVDQIPLARSSRLIGDTGIIGAELRCFKKETEGRCFGNMDVFWA